MCVCVWRGRRTGGGYAKMCSHARQVIDAGLVVNAASGPLLHLTQAGALAGSRVATEPARVAKYTLTMERYARFVRDGCKDGLAGRGAAAPDGWVIKSGQDKGAPLRPPGPPSC